MQLCKFKARDLGLSTNNKNWEIGLLEQKTPEVYYLTSKICNRYMTHIRDWNPETLVVIGEVNDIMNRDYSIVKAFNTLIEKLELPDTNSLMNMLNDESFIPIETLNTPMSSEELLSKIDVNILKKQLIKTTMFAEYMKTLLEYIIENKVDTPQISESLDEESIFKPYRPINENELRSFVNTSAKKIKVNEVERISEADNQPTSIENEPVFRSSYTYTINSDGKIGILAGKEPLI